MGIYAKCDKLRKDYEYVIYYTFDMPLIVSRSRLFVNVRNSMPRDLCHE